MARHSVRLGVITIGMIAIAGCCPPSYYNKPYSKIPSIIGGDVPTIRQALDRSGFRVRSVHRQFVLPITFHRIIGSRRFTIKLEDFLDRLGLLKRFGSPVTVVAERCAP